MELIARRDFLKVLGPIGALVLVTQVGVACPTGKETKLNETESPTAYPTKVFTLPETITTASIKPTNYSPSFVSESVPTTTATIVDSNPATETKPKATTSIATLNNIIKLPEPIKKEKFSVKEALAQRRSIRNYSGQVLTLFETSQLLWVAQGVTNYRGYPTAPSAVAGFLLQTYLIAVNVDDIAARIYHFKPLGRHSKYCVWAIIDRD